MDDLHIGLPCVFCFLFLCLTFVLLLPLFQYFHHSPFCLKASPLGFFWSICCPENRIAAQYFWPVPNKQLSDSLGNIVKKKLFRCLRLGVFQKVSPLSIISLRLNLPKQRSGSLGNTGEAARRLGLQALP